MLGVNHLLLFWARICSALLSSSGALEKQSTDKLESLISPEFVGFEPILPRQGEPGVGQGLPEESQAEEDTQITWILELF